MKRRIKYSYLVAGELYCRSSVSLSSLIKLANVLENTFDRLEVSVNSCVGSHHVNAQFVVLLSCPIRDAKDATYKCRVGQIVRQFCEQLGSCPGLGSSRPLGVTGWQFSRMRLLS
jgi:hypothetical protein